MTKGTALVTGAASGIGAACSKALSSAGYTVIGWDRDSAGPSENGAPMVVVDVSRIDEVVDAARSLPPLAAVVTCAGISLRASAKETTPNEWEKVIGVNLTGTFNTAVACHEALKSGAGTLITIGSICATAAFRDRAAYCSSKAAVVMLTRCLAAEWATDGIRVLAVSPGFTRTPMAQEGIDSGLTNLDAILAHTPMGRLLEPEEIADMVVTLIGRDARGMSGSNILVDGGFDALTGF